MGEPKVSEVCGGQYTGGEYIGVLRYRLRLPCSVWTGTGDFSSPLPSLSVPSTV